MLDRARGIIVADLERIVGGGNIKDLQAVCEGAHEGIISVQGHPVRAAVHIGTISQGRVRGVADIDGLKLAVVGLEEIRGYKGIIAGYGNSHEIAG